MPHRETVRAAAHLSSGGALHASTSIPRLDAYATQIRRVFWAEAARGADLGGQEPDSADVLTRWEDDLETCRAFLTARPALLLNQINTHLP